MTFQGKGSSNVEKPTRASGGTWYLAAYYVEMKTKLLSIHFHAFAQRLSKQRKHSPDIKLNVRLPLDKSISWFLHKWPYHQPNTYPLPNALTRVCAHMKASRKQSTLHTHTQHPGDLRGARRPWVLQVGLGWPDAVDWTRTWLLPMLLGEQKQRRDRSRLLKHPPTTQAKKNNKNKHRRGGRGRRKKHNIGQHRCQLQRWTLRAANHGTADTSHAGKDWLTSLCKEREVNRNDKDV